MSGLQTETIRKIYADGDAESEWFFDTWLAKHDAWAAETERNRIIRLLKANNQIEAVILIEEELTYRKGEN